MAIIIKSSEEIAIMREAGEILHTILFELERFTEIGKTTKEIDQYAEKLIKKYGVVASFKNYKGFPATICSSVNEQVVHTIPTSDMILKDGDILTIDCGVLYKGFHSDSAITILIGNVDPAVKEFVFVVKKALKEGISRIKPGTKLNVIGETIQKIIEDKHGYSIVKELTGHGIGRELHEDPFVLNYKDHSNNIVLEEGMTLAIEPIVAMGGSEIITLKDQWTIITADKMPACQWEHTVAVTKDGCEILTA
ncbi:type I methionyl aminopeptidase [Patescibacteria group bacterium]